MIENQQKLVISAYRKITSFQAPDARVHERCVVEACLGLPRVHTGVGAQTRHVVATVVETEPKPAAQLRQRGLGLDRRVQVGDPAAHVDPAAGPTGQRGREDVADPLMRCRRQQSGRSDRVGNRRHIGDRADLLTLFKYERRSW
jgi:hypothetical protein